MGIREMEVKRQVWVDGREGVWCMSLVWVHAES